MQYVRGYTNAEGVAVPGYFRAYSPTVGEEARSSPFVLSATNRNPAYPNLGLEQLQGQIRASQGLPGGYSYHFTPYNPEFEAQLRSGSFVVNPDVATGRSLAPGVQPFVDAGGSLKFEITSEGRGTYGGRSRGLYGSNPIVQDFTDGILSRTIKPVVQYDSSGNPVNVNFGYGAYGFGGAEAGESKAVLSNPNRAIAIRTPTSTEVAATGRVPLLTFEQFAAQTGITQRDLQANYQLVKDQYEAYVAGRGQQGYALENVRGRYGENQRISAPQTPYVINPAATQELVFRSPGTGFYRGIPHLEDIFAPYKSALTFSGLPQRALPVQRDITLSDRRNISGRGERS